MKSYYNLAQALLNQRHPQEALETAKHAYRICLEIKDSSAEVLSQFILRTKQAQWQARETNRLRDLNETLAVVEALLDQQLERDLADIEARFSRQELGETGREEERQQLQTEADQRRSNIREAMRDPERPETAERVVPDYLIDGITFEIMHDPVITPSGMSYERVGLLRHLKVAGVDPITREALSERMLVTNLGLKNACAEFLERNGWAVDY
jgi:STIP1 homology and U-box containing protein 1